jgi:hypothetical protein
LDDPGRNLFFIGATKMIRPLIRPTQEAVDAACKIFDEGNRLIESTLRQLFDRVPRNDNLEDVFLKVITLNLLYTTQIRLYAKAVPTTVDVANHIQKNAFEIDSALRDGSERAVELIADVSVTGKEKRSYFSFATKYCSWSNPKAFPIFDSRVEKYLVSLFRHDNFAAAGVLRGKGCNYTKFRELIDEFRRHYGLQTDSYKEVDKFLYQSGSTLFE